MIISHWSLNDRKSPQVSRTLLSILVNLNNALVLMVSTCPLISKCLTPCTNPFVTIPNALLTICITVIYVLLLFGSLSRSTYLTLCSLSFSFTFWSAGMMKSTFQHFLFFFCYVTYDLDFRFVPSDPIFVWQAVTQWWVNRDMAERISQSSTTGV